MCLHTGTCAGPSGMKEFISLLLVVLCIWLFWHSIATELHELWVPCLPPLWSLIPMLSLFLHVAWLCHEGWQSLRMRRILGGRCLSSPNWYFPNPFHTQTTSYVTPTEVFLISLPNIRLLFWYKKCWYPLTLKSHAPLCLDPSALRWCSQFFLPLGIIFNTISPRLCRFPVP